jgi:hypothetical protein
MPILGIIASQISGHLYANSYEAIATSTLGTDTQFITFSSIPSTYTSLQLRIRGNSNGGPKITFNSSGTGYSEHRLVGNGTAASAGGSTGNADFGNQGSLVPGGGGGLSGQETAYIIDILDYQSTNKNKTVRALSGYDANGSGSIRLGSALWANTAAINTIKIDSDTGSVWYAGTVFSLYGIK